jgi:hypothetical protein
LIGSEYVPTKEVASAAFAGASTSSDEGGSSAMCVFVCVGYESDMNELL